MLIALPEARYKTYSPARAEFSHADNQRQKKAGSIEPADFLFTGGGDQI
jgi:hypothetical protein